MGMNGVLNSATGESFSLVLARLQGEGATGVLTLIDSATGQKASVRLLEGRVAEAALGTAEGAAALDAMSGLDSWWYRFQSGAVSEPKERGVTATLKPTASPVPSAGTPVGRRRGIPGTQVEDRGGWLESLYVRER